MTKRISVDNELELIILAKTSSDESTLHTLSKSCFSTVRKCVAKNNNTPTSILNILSRDSAQNVSFFANANPNCTNKREIFSTHPCIVCNIDESQYHLVCGSCERK